MKPTANMLRRPGIFPASPGRASVITKDPEPTPSVDPIAERRQDLARALAETVAERKNRTIESRVEERIAERSNALSSEPELRSGEIQARLIGYDDATECEPAARLPLGGVPVRLAIGDQEYIQTTGAAGLVQFELDPKDTGSYVLEVMAEDGRPLTSVQGAIKGSGGATHRLEVGRSSQLEPAFARGRNLVLAVDRAQTQAAKVGARVDSALARQEESLRKEIAALDAMLASPPTQAKGESHGTYPKG